MPQIRGSCTPQVEFEISTGVPTKATADCRPTFFLCMQMSGGKKATAGTAIGGGSHRGSPFQWWP